MYRIHFTAAGALRTERAVLEFGVDGIRWRFREATAADPSMPLPRRLPKSLVMRDFADRLATLRHRRSRRARAMALLNRPGRFLLGLLGVQINRLNGATDAQVFAPLKPSTMPLVQVTTGQENQ